uniref:LsmAD domain-containing protein n=1 Tax=Caenorhabditis japonica TaxID=281687 RepID=A0A8R1DVB4_CAEJA
MVSAPEVLSAQAVDPQSAKTDLSVMNGAVLHAFMDMIGRETIVTTIENKRYSGYAATISNDPANLAIGLTTAVELHDGNRHHLLRTQSEVIEKFLIKFDDIVDIAFITQEDKGKNASKFVTDKKWCPGDDGDEIGGSIEEQDSSNQHNRRVAQNYGPGWSVDAMFAANEKMNVVSTFKEDLTQYTTVEVSGTDEDRARADRLAREIESNQSSKFYANLENDDVERDLDKTTREDDFEYNNQRRKGNTSYNQQSHQKRNQNPNITPNGQPVNRRAEGLRSDRRNSGGSSSVNNNRYGSGYSQSQNYQQQGSKGGYGGNRRQNDEYRENDWPMAKEKGQNQGHDQSFRHQQKQMLDARPSPKQTTTTTTNEGDKSQTSSSRVADLKTWGNEFAIATSPKEQSPAPAGGNSASAWTRGPPSSLVGKGSSTESTPPPAEIEAPSPSATVAATAAATSSSKPVVVEVEKREDSPSTSGEGQDNEDGKQNDGDTDASDTSSVITTKSTSFKFNINAPEFKPRVAPTTPTPTTPTGPLNAPIPAQQFSSPEYAQYPGMVPQGGAPMGMVPHMVQGGVPNNQGQPMMMWHQPGQQGYPGNQPYQMQQIAMPPGQLYGANAPATVQGGPGNQQVPTSVAGGAPTDGRQIAGPRNGDFKEPCFYPYTQGGPVVQVAANYYPSQFQGGIPQGQYPVKILPPQQAPQGYPRGYQQPVYIPAQPQQPRYQQQHPQQQQQQQQQQQFGGEQQGGPQSHPNSQPTTPGPRGEAAGPKQGHQNGNNREPEGGSSASLSGSASSQSGQRSGSPQNAVPVLLLINSLLHHHHSSNNYNTEDHRMDKWSEFRLDTYRM